MLVLPNDLSVFVDQNQENKSNLNFSKTENKDMLIKKTALGVFAGLALLTIGYQAVNAYNNKIFRDFFSNLLENDIESAEKIADECLVKDNDVNCQYAIKETYYKLLKTHTLKGLLFSEKCIDYPSRASQEVVKEAFFTFLEKDRLHVSIMAKKCIGNVHSSCQEIVKNAFSLFLKNDVYQARDFAKACVGHPHKNTQQVVKEAYVGLLEQGKQHADYLIYQCKGKTDEACQYITEESLKS